MDASRTAAEIAEAVRARREEPAKVVALHLERIDELQPRLGSFRTIRREAALREAEQLGKRSDLEDLPLAGVPVAIKDNIEVRGEPTLHGSEAFSDALADHDHEVSRRLRDAGAVIVGKTNLPELGLWPSTDGRYGIARNPWDTSKASGGSSGGAAAAVSSGMVPIAHGNDGAGSIRIPSAVCGTYGIKPGHGLVPQNRCHWFEMTENGPITTTVHDAATMLAVMAGRPDLAKVDVPDRRLKIALSTKPPLKGLRVDRAVKDAVLSVGEALQHEGHSVIPADPPYNASARTSAIVRWLAGALEDRDLFDRNKLEPRARRHMRAGEIALKLNLLRDTQAERWRKRVGPFFERYDLVILPTVARVSLDVGPWAERGWSRNVWTSLNFAPFTGLWNLAPFPAASVPAGLHEGLPVGVQIVGPPRSESTILALSKQIEDLRPWPRHAPI